MSVTEVVIKGVMDGDNIVKLTDFGLRGQKGDKGDTGDQGPPGNDGVGLKGDKGDQGDQGDQGSQGVPGLKGDKGDVGATGLKGDQGDPGVQGEPGLKGDKGDTGPQGLKGDKGDRGDSYDVAALEGVVGQNSADIQQFILDAAGNPINNASTLGGHTAAEFALIRPEGSTSAEPRRWEFDSHSFNGQALGAPGRTVRHNYVFDVSGPTTTGSCGGMIHIDAFVVGGDFSYPKLSLSYYVTSGGALSRDELTVRNPFDPDLCGHYLKSANELVVWFEANSFAPSSFVWMELHPYASGDEAEPTVFVAYTEENEVY